VIYHTEVFSGRARICPGLQVARRRRAARLSILHGWTCSRRICRCRCRIVWQVEPMICLLLYTTSTPAPILAPSLSRKHAKGLLLSELLREPCVSIHRACAQVLDLWHAQFSMLHSLRRLSKSSCVLVSGYCANQIVGDSNVPSRGGNVNGNVMFLILALETDVSAGRD
jgi:hypothetical protein